MFRYLVRSSTLAVLLLAAAAVPAAADSAATRAVWEQHVAAATAGDIDAVMADFTDQSAIVTTDGALVGLDRIRGFFADFLAAGSPDDAVAVNAFIVHDDVVVFNFTVAGQTFHDTAVVRDGKIAVLTTVGYPAD